MNELILSRRTKRKRGATASRDLDAGPAAYVAHDDAIVVVKYAAMPWGRDGCADFARDMVCLNSPGSILSSSMAAAADRAMLASSY